MPVYPFTEGWEEKPDLLGDIYNYFAGKPGLKTAGPAPRAPGAGVAQVRPSDFSDHAVMPAPAGAPGAAQRMAEAIAAQGQKSQDFFSKTALGSFPTGKLAIDTAAAAYQLPKGILQMAKDFGTSSQEWAARKKRGEPIPEWIEKAHQLEYGDPNWERRSRADLDIDELGPDNLSLAKIKFMGLDGAEDVLRAFAAAAITVQDGKYKTDRDVEFSLTKSLGLPGKAKKFKGFESPEAVAQQLTLPSLLGGLGAAGEIAIAPALAASLNPMLRAMNRIVPDRVKQAASEVKNSIKKGAGKAGEKIFSLRSEAETLYLMRRGNNRQEALRLIGEGRPGEWFEVSPGSFRHAGPGVEESRALLREGSGHPELTLGEEFPDLAGPDIQASSLAEYRRIQQQNAAAAERLEPGLWGQAAAGPETSMGALAEAIESTGGLTRPDTPSPTQLRREIMSGLEEPPHPASAVQQLLREGLIEDRLGGAGAIRPPAQVSDPLTEFGMTSRGRPGPSTQEIGPSGYPEPYGGFLRGPEEPPRAPQVSPRALELMEEGPPWDPSIRAYPRPPRVGSRDYEIPPTGPYHLPGGPPGEYRGPRGSDLPVLPQGAPEHPSTFFGPLTRERIDPRWEALWREEWEKYNRQRPGDEPPPGAAPLAEPPGPGALPEGVTPEPETGPGPAAMAGLEDDITQIDVPESVEAESLRAEVLDVIEEGGDTAAVREVLEEVAEDAPAEVQQIVEQIEEQITAAEALPEPDMPLFQTRPEPEPDIPFQTGIREGITEPDYSLAPDEPAPAPPAPTTGGPAEAIAEEILPAAGAGGEGAGLGGGRIATGGEGAGPPDTRDFTLRNDPHVLTGPTDPISAYDPVSATMRHKDKLPRHLRKKPKHLEDLEEWAAPRVETIKHPIGSPEYNPTQIVTRNGETLASRPLGEVDWGLSDMGIGIREGREKLKPWARFLKRAKKLKFWKTSKDTIVQKLHHRSENLRVAFRNSSWLKGTGKWDAWGPPREYARLWDMVEMERSWKWRFALVRELFLDRVAPDGAVKPVWKIMRDHFFRDIDEDIALFLHRSLLEEFSNFVKPQTKTAMGGPWGNKTALQLKAMFPDYPHKLAFRPPTLEFLKEIQDLSVVPEALFDPIEGGGLFAAQEASGISFGWKDMGPMDNSLAARHLRRTNQLRVKKQFPGFVAAYKAAGGKAKLPPRPRVEPIPLDYEPLLPEGGPPKRGRYTPIGAGGPFRAIQDLLVPERTPLISIGEGPEPAKPRRGMDKRYLDLRRQVDEGDPRALVPFTRASISAGDFNNPAVIEFIESGNAPAELVRGHAEGAMRTRTDSYRSWNLGDWGDALQHILTPHTELLNMDIEIPAIPRPLIRLSPAELTRYFDASTPPRPEGLGGRRLAQTASILRGFEDIDPSYHQAVLGELRSGLPPGTTGRVVLVRERPAPWRGSSYYRDPQTRADHRMSLVLDVLNQEFPGRDPFTGLSWSYYRGPGPGQPIEPIGRIYTEVPVEGTLYDWNASESIQVYSVLVGPPGGGK